MEVEAIDNYAQKVCEELEELLGLSGVSEVAIFTKAPSARVILRMLAASRSRPCSAAIIFVF